MKPPGCLPTPCSGAPGHRSATLPAWQSPGRAAGEAGLSWQTWIDIFRLLTSSRLPASVPASTRVGNLPPWCWRVLPASAFDQNAFPWQRRIGCFSGDSPRSVVFSKAEPSGTQCGAFDFGRFRHRPQTLHQTLHRCRFARCRPILIGCRFGLTAEWSLCRLSSAQLCSAAGNSRWAACP